ncbi:MAG: hypothetical protein OJF52_003495 [Nitrospira sp.]|nr:MAG: hypothetical protein OJF52_003495 [Nitrospira sp.]
MIRRWKLFGESMKVFTALYLLSLDPKSPLRKYSEDGHARLL